MAPPPTPPFARPARPNDPNVALAPARPHNVLGNEGYRRDVEANHVDEGPAGVPNDSYDYTLVRRPAARTVPRREDVAYLSWQEVSRQLCNVIRDTFQQEGKQLVAAVEKAYAEGDQKTRRMEQKICEELDKDHREIQQIRGVVQQVSAKARVVSAQVRQFRAELQRTHTTLHHMRGEMLPGRRRQTYLRKRGDLTLEIISFVNGDDPTRQPHKLPHLVSANAIDHLRGQDLIAYLKGYGINPLPVGRHTRETNRLRKETLKRLVGATF